MRLIDADKVLEHVDKFEQRYGSAKYMNWCALKHFINIMPTVLEPGQAWTNGNALRGDDVHEMVISVDKLRAFADQCGICNGDECVRCILRNVSTMTV